MSSSIRSSNASAWRHIAEFLEDQELARLGLRRVRNTGPTQGREQAQRRALRGPVCSLPDGNHGENIKSTTAVCE